MRHAALTTLFALTACGGPAPAPTPALPVTARMLPGTTHYLVAEHRHVEQQYQGQPVVTDAVTRTSLTVAIEAAPSGFVVDVVVDSAAVDGDAGMPSGLAQAAAGARFRANLSPAGVMTTVTGPTYPNPLIDQLALGLPEFLPRLPADGARPGSIWGDTAEITGRTAGLPIALDVRAEHRAEPWLALDGERVLPVTTETGYGLTGEGERAGQWITMTGTGRSQIQRFLTPEGVVALGIRTDTLQVTIELRGSGLRIPLTQIRTDTVRRVIP